MLLSLFHSTTLLHGTLLCAAARSITTSITAFISPFPWSLLLTARHTPHSSQANISDVREAGTGGFSSNITIVVRPHDAPLTLLHGGRQGTTHTRQNECMPRHNTIQIILSLISERLGPVRVVVVVRWQDASSSWAANLSLCVLLLSK